MFKRFKNESVKLSAIIKEKETAFGVKENIDSTEGAEQALESHNYLFRETKQIYETRYQDLRKVATELLSERFELSAEVQNTDSGLDRQFKKTLETANVKQKALEKRTPTSKITRRCCCKRFC